MIMNKINFGKISRVILFGGSKHLVDIIEILKKKKIEIYVFTNNKQAMEIIRDEKKTLLSILKRDKINFQILKSLDKNKKALQKLINKETLGISVSSWWIFKESEISLFPKKKLINIHGAFLPSFAGRGGKSWQILTNETLSGLTIHLIDKTIDRGRVLFQSSYKFPKRTFDSLKQTHEFAYNQEAKIIKNFFRLILNRKDFYPRINSNLKENKDCYWPKLNAKTNAWINWNWSAIDICKFVNAFGDPYDEAKTLLEKRIIKIKSAKLANSKLNFHPFQNGLIYKINKNNIFVACSGGGIILNIKDFKIEVKLLGKRLITTQKIIDYSLKYL